MEANSTTLLIVFIGLTSAAILLQAGILLGIFLSLRKTAKSLTEVTGDIKATVIPLVHSTRELVDRISPQIVTVSSGLADLTELAQREAQEAHLSIAEINGRVQRQTARLDGMLTSALDRIERVGGAVEHTVSVPVRHANGVVAALKAVFDTYRSTPGTSRRRTEVPDPDRDLVS